MMKWFTCIEMVLIIAFLALVFTMIGRSSYGEFPYYMIPLPLAMVLSCLFFPVTMFWFVKISTQSQAEMKKVCEDLSAKHQGISFSLQDEQVLVNSGNRVKMQTRNYIEGMFLCINIHSLLIFAHMNSKYIIVFSFCSIKY